MKRLILRELTLSLRHAADTTAALLFFIIAGTLFAFSVGPDSTVLKTIAVGVVWVCALLAALLPLDRLFGADFEDGTLDLLLLSGLPASGVAMAKAVVHWLTTGLPLLLMAGPLAVMLRLSVTHIPLLLLTLLPGTMLLSLLGTLAGAVTLGARRAAVLMPLITLPLMIPTLIFGTAAVTSPHPAAPLYMLAAMLILALPLAPLGAGAALRAAAE
jgi:heme exporter protein B